MYIIYILLFILWSNLKNKMLSYLILSYLNRLFLYNLGCKITTIVTDYVFAIISDICLF